MKTIGFFAQKRSGKDTAADFVCDKLAWKKVGFADPIKKIFSETFNVSYEFIEEWKTKKEIPPGFNGLIRDGLVNIGDGFRQTLSNVWINKLFNDHKEKVAICDGRYINEANTIQSKDGITVLIWRKDFENNDNSPSEQEVMPFVKELKGTPSRILNTKPFDIWLTNDGTIEDFHQKIDTIVIPYLKDRFNE